MMRVFHFLALAALALLGAGRPALAQAPQGFVVVVHVGNPFLSIERQALAQMFLKQLALWPDGFPVEPVDLSVKERSRTAFTKSVHGRSVSAVRAYWQQQIFSGRNVPPPEKRGEKDVIEFIKLHPGAIGYVSATVPLGAGVKIITVVDARP
jgi:ABC-type phosphate transport system substrate-binding protein